MRVFARLRRGFEERQDLDRGEEQREHAREREPRQRAPRHDSQSPRGGDEDDVQRGLGMSREEEQREGDRQQRHRCAADGEEDQRCVRPREAERVEDEQRDRRGVREPRRRDERGGLAAAELASEQERAEGGDQVSDRGAEGHTQCRREEARQERERTERRGLRGGREDVAGEDEAIPQRPLAVRERPAHGGAPRDHLRRDVGEVAVVRRDEAVLLLHPVQRHEVPGVIDRAVHAGREERVPDEDEREQEEDGGGRAGEAQDEAVSQPEEEQGRGRVEEERQGPILSRAEVRDLW